MVSSNIEETGLEEPLEEKIGPVLLRRGLQLVLAESCTGGLIGHRITNVAGSSAYYLGSVTAYAYEAKERLLGVQHDTLTRYGAVSRETVLEMARGARAALAGDFGIQNVIGVSVSGIAGPGGGMPGKPVGLVWIGMSTPEGEHAWRFHFHGERVENKHLSAQAALQLIWDYLEERLPSDD